MKQLFFFLLAGYRAAKTLLPAPLRCRHWPSCSAYAEEAVRRHDLITGLSLALKRLSRCHPWGTMGYDPVPEKVAL